MENKGKKIGKEKLIKATSFSPFRPGVLSVRDEGSCVLLKILQNVLF